MPLFLPNISRVDTPGGGTIVGTPTQSAANLFRNVDEGRIAVRDPAALAPPGPDDSNFVTFSGLGAGKRLWLKFAIPNYYTSKSYGDGYQMVEGVRIASITIRIRARNATGQAIAIVMSRDGGSTTPQIGVDTTLTTNFAWYEFTAFNDPLTGIAWLPENLASPTEFALSVNASSATDLSVMHIETVEAFGAGGVRARVKPLLMEPSLFCAICGQPSHLRELVKVEDPDSPQAGWWVCKQDLDAFDRPEDEEPTLIDGEIDFDL